MGDIFSYRKREQEINDKLQNNNLMAQEREIWEKLQKMNHSAMYQHCSLIDIFLTRNKKK